MSDQPVAALPTQAESSVPRVDTNTWPMWVIALLPLLDAANNFVPFPDPRMSAVPFTLSVASVVLSALIYVAVVLLAVADHRMLQRRGVPQPLPWGWAFLQTIYVIARFVVVRRRVKGSLAPLWVWIASTVILITTAHIR